MLSRGRYCDVTSETFYGCSRWSSAFETHRKMPQQYRTPQHDVCDLVELVLPSRLRSTCDDRCNAAKILFCCVGLVIVGGEALRGDPTPPPIPFISADTTDVSRYRSPAIRALRLGQVCRAARGRRRTRATQAPGPAPSRTPSVIVMVDVARKISESPGINHDDFYLRF